MKNSTFTELAVPLSRFALFLLYVWFGVLKILGTSPASPMVQELLSRTMPFISFDLFIVLFGAFEVLIGILFIIPKCNKIALVLFTAHMITTTLPLFIMTSFVWTGPLTPTLEGQYIIKNIALIACALTVFSDTTSRASLQV